MNRDWNGRKGALGGKTFSLQYTSLILIILTFVAAVVVPRDEEKTQAGSADVAYSTEGAKSYSTTDAIVIEGDALKSVLNCRALLGSNGLVGLRKAFAIALDTVLASHDINANIVLHPYSTANQLTHGPTKQFVITKDPQKWAEAAFRLLRELTDNGFMPDGAVNVVVDTRQSEKLCTVELERDIESEKLAI